MSRLSKSCLVILFLAVACGVAFAEPVKFNLLTHADNVQWLPQSKNVEGVSGDHLIQTPDDITSPSLNPNGCFTFLFMNPYGVHEPDYPPGWAKGIHSMVGSLILDLDLCAGGDVDFEEMDFDGYVAPGMTSSQYLVKPGEPATNGNYGPLDGLPNSGAYSASAAGNWALDLTFDQYLDTPFAGHPSIDITFDNYVWDGFIIPVGKLTPEGMAEVELNDPLGYYGGTSEDFEAWLLDEVAPRLPDDATWLMFAQGEDHPDWTHPMMGMTTDGVVGQTLVAYTTVPEPATVILLAVSAAGLAGAARRKQRSTITA